MANNVNLSPGTYVTEKDLSFSVEALGVTTLGLVGETQRGPAFQALFVKNYDVFKTLYGGTSAEKFRNSQIPKYELPYIAKSYLTQSNQMYVTRILGLSGYDMGKAYTLKTIGAIDTTDIGYSASGFTKSDLSFTYDLTTPGAVPMYVDASNNPIATLSSHVAALTGVNETKFDLAFASYFNTTNYSTKNWFVGDILKWGQFPESQMAIYIAESLLNTNKPTPVIVVDSYEIPANVQIADEADYFFLNEFVFNSGTQNYTGLSFASYCHQISSLSVNVVEGSFNLALIGLSGFPVVNYHNKQVATLRSRGQYVSDVLNFNVTALGIGDATQIKTNPYGTFTLTGTTAASITPFSYNISLNSSKKNYAKNVLGVSAFDKTANVYVEELYDSVLAKGVNENKIAGLYSTLATEATWNHYQFQYLSPLTPYFVSELRGGDVQRLFRVISVSDGKGANTMCKVSITNVDLAKKTFDLFVRDFNDSDKNVLILERFVGCTMNEEDDSYVGKKIGTADNKYDLKSSYIIIEMDDSAPSDAVPAGFEGYEFRADLLTNVPDIFYKTKYYKAGDIMSSPLLGVPLVSNGDKVKKTYLGFTDLEYGYDIDLLSFKGKISNGGTNTYNNGNDYSTMTKGFHMDINASSVKFAVGAGTFEDATAIALDSTHPYNDIKTRKFTCLFSGGFDGWDEFRENRTNGDTYKIGKAGFVASNFTTFASPEFNDTFGTSDYYAYQYGIRVYENPEATIINILATPGIDIINNTELVRDTIEMMEDKRKDSIYVPTLPDMQLIGNTSPSNTDVWLYPSDIVDALDNAEIDSSYAAVYYPWIQVLDTENNANIFVPPTAEVVRNMAYTDNVAHPWYASAGYSRGIVNTKRARLQIDQDGRDILYEGRVNPLPTFTDVGVVIFGNKNLQVKDSAMNRISVKRLLLQAQKLIISVANRLLFDPNDAQVRNSFLSQVNPILDNIRKERGLSDFRVILSAENAEDVDRNSLNGKISIKPISSLEFIELEFSVAPNNVSFGAQ